MGDWAITGYDAAEGVRGRNSSETRSEGVSGGARDIDIAGEMKKKSSYGARPKAESDSTPPVLYDKPTYQYENGRLASITKKSKDGLRSEVTYYGEDGKITGSVRENRREDEVKQERFDKNGNLMYKYDKDCWREKNGNIHESKSYKYANGKWDYFQNTYDKDGNPIELEKFMNGVERKVVHDGDRILFFDENNNVRAQID